MRCLAPLLALLIPSLLLAHEGHLDEDGCHINSMVGDYHCQEGKFKGRSWDTQGEAKEEMEGGVVSHYELLQEPDKVEPSTVVPLKETPRPYQREQWEGWIDEDGDCQDTREEVLIAKSLIPVTFKTGKKCSVQAGLWLCPLTGELFKDPEKLEVVHSVPLKNVHESGGWKWEEGLRRFYVNDLGHPEHLIAVDKSALQAREAKEQAQWLPPGKVYLCRYAENWKMIKTRWGLAMTEVEAKALEGIRQDCIKGL